MHFILVIPKIDIGSKSKIVNLSITTSVVVLTNVESINTTSVVVIDRFTNFYRLPTSVLGTTDIEMCFPHPF